MRLLVIGNRNGQLGAAARMVMDRGAAVRHADGIDTALAMLSQVPAATGPGADLAIVDAALDIEAVGVRLAAAGMAVPVLACAGHDDGGSVSDPGTGDYLALPAQPEAIAAILAAIVDTAAGASGAETAQRGLQTGRAAHAALAAAAVTPGLVGRTVADVERDLIVETLRRCLGNRTHAASILGISVRTLRNKLTVYAAEGIEVPPPHQGEIRGAA